MPALGAFGGARGEEDLEAGVGEDDRAHVAAVGDQAGQASKRRLDAEHGLAHAGPGRDARGERADRLEAKRIADVGAGEEGAAGGEAQVHGARERLERRLVVGLDAGLQRRDRGRAVDRAGVEQDVAERGGDRARQRALAGGGRAVDRERRDRAGNGRGDREQRLEVVGPGLGDAARVDDPHRHRWRRAAAPLKAASDIAIAMRWSS